MYGYKNHCCNISGNSVSHRFGKRALMLLLCILLGGITVYSQKVIRKNDTFVQVSKKKQKETYKLTPYTYVASDGTKYPIYISDKGKYFIIRKSKKTGKEYRHYLPKVQEQLEQK